MLACAAMRAALEGRAAAGRPAPTRRTPPLTPVLVAAAGALLALSVLRGQGADTISLFSIGSGAALLATCGLAGVALGLVPRPQVGHAGALLLVTLVAWVAWLGLSIVWSIEPDRSWGAFNRGLSYLALLGVGVLAGGLVRRAPRLTAGGLAVIFALALLWALAGKVVPELDPDVVRSARLREPVGYWNALGLLVAMSLPLWLWVAARREQAAPLRAGAVAALLLSTVALVLTGSRGGVLVAAAAVLVWLVLGGDRLESTAALLLAVPAGLVVSAWALGRPGLAEAGVGISERSRDGAVLGMVLAVAAALVFALALLGARAEPTPERRLRLARLAAALAALLVVGGLVLGVARVGDPVAWAGDRLEEFRNPPGEEVTQDPGRFATTSSNHRWTWWTEAWRLFRAHPAGGTGAGTFELARRPLREDTQQPLAPHNAALQALSETGLAGFALLLAAAGAAAAVVIGALRRLEGGERAAAAALTAAMAAYLAHSLIDLGWEYVAVSAPVFLSLGVLASAGREAASATTRRPLVALSALVVALAAVTSLGSPWLAERRLDRAYEALIDGDTRAAASAARGAAALNPLTVEPLHVQAVAAEADGDQDEAERLYRRAASLQPENPEAWYQLGRFRFETRRDLDGAYADLNRSYNLDSFHPRTGELLDEVRAAYETRG